MKFKFVSILLALCTTAGSMTMPAFAVKTQAAAEENLIPSGTENGTTAAPGEDDADKKDAQEDYTYNTTEDHTIEITGYKGTDTAPVIPDTIEGRQVTSIKSYAFARLNNVETITIPDSVANIGEGAFSEIRSLKNITLPKGVTSIPDYAFTGCENLKQVVFPEGMKSIGESAFSACRSLETVTLPDSLRNIDFSAFSSCSSLRSISFPKSLEIIGEDAFLGCKNLKNAEFSEGLRLISEGAFVNCSSLERINLPVSTKEIGQNAFSGCDSLKKIIYAGSKTARKKMLVIGQGNTQLLQSVITYSNGKSETFAPKKGTKLKNGSNTYQIKTDVSEAAFVKTTAKTAKVTVPAYATIDGIRYSVASVTKNAFLNNKKVTKITIEGDIKSIGKAAFRGCTKLDTIIIRSNRLESAGANAFRGIRPDAKIKVSNVHLNAYKKLLKHKGQGSRVKIMGY